MSGLGLNIASSTSSPSSSSRQPRITIKPHSASTSNMSSPSTPGWLNQLRSQKYSLLPSNSSPASPELLPRTATFRKKLFAVSFIALIFVGSAGYVLKSDKATNHVGPYKEWEEGMQMPPEIDVSGWESENTPPLQQEDEGSDDQTQPEGEGPVAVGSEVGSDEGPTDLRGYTEDMGWHPPADSGLVNLGEVAEGRYRLHMGSGEEGSRTYFRQLYDFAVTLPMDLHIPFLASLSKHAPPIYPDIVPALPFFPDGLMKTFSPAMISYKTIHQTDKTYNPDNELSTKWKDMNSADGWALNFLDDQGAHDWMQSVFARSSVEWAWNFMHRGVLKADFLRYLLPLVQGGVYSDVDTEPIRPIEQWGHTGVEYLSLHATDGFNWRRKLSTHPAVVVAIDVDVHSYPNWQDSWPRPLGICQWTLSAAPNHPIFIDAVRRVVNASRVVEDWENWRAEESQRLDEQGKFAEAQELRDQHRDHAMNVMEWTGPGLFTDSVLSYILARYGVTWHRLRGLDHPLRIGEVLILPITAFSPGGQPDFRAEGPDSPQANVLHNFRGSWKSDGAR